MFLQSFTEWMMDGVWPDDITPSQCADMVDFYIKLVGVDHVSIASDDMFTTESTMNFARANPTLYADGGYMVIAFEQGSSGCGELAKILPAVTDELWKRGYSDEDLQKVYGGNKMRVYREVWEGVAAEDDSVDPTKRREYIDKLRAKWQSR